MVSLILVVGSMFFLISGVCKWLNPIFLNVIGIIVFEISIKLFNL